MQGVSSVWGHALFCPANKIFWRELMKKGSKAGYVLQMICGITMLVYSCLVIVAGILTSGLTVLRQPVFYLGVLVSIGGSVLFIVFAILGKKRVWPNVINLIITAFPLLSICISLIVSIISFFF